MLLKGKPGPVGLPSEPPVNTLFLAALTTGIEDKRNNRSRLPGTSYTPSALNCLRQMYYKRRQTPPDITPDSYTDVGMSDTGIRRHEAIQEVLLWMNEQPGNRFLYINVATYIDEKHKCGRCQNIVVTGTEGAETALWDRERDIRFRCDGIIYDSKTKQFYLFEFKNQISFKANDKQSVDEAHHNQIAAYCALLELSQAFVVYENRDTCELYCPELYKISPFDKSQVLKKIDDCEAFVRKSTPPPVPVEATTTNLCKWCKYKSACKFDAKREAEVNGNG